VGQPQSWSSGQPSLSCILGRKSESPGRVRLRRGAGGGGGGSIVDWNER
jgi:hypothetical protein